MHIHARTPLAGALRDVSIGGSCRELLREDNARCFEEVRVVWRAGERVSGRVGEKGGRYTMLICVVWG